MGLQVTALDLFTALADLIPEAIETEFERRDCCILAARLAVEVASHFGILAYPVSVKVVLMNAQFAAHVKAGDKDVRKWGPIDGSHSVGIGYGFKPGSDTRNRWDGHLIAVTDDCFGDFAIQQAERIEKGIITGPAIVGPRQPEYWRVVSETTGTLIYYERTHDMRFRSSPDWKDNVRRRKLAGPLIRQMQEKFS